MKFKFYTLNGFTFIDAYPEQEDTLTANRLEGVGQEISLRTTTVWFDSEYKGVHPDVVAAVCLAIYYPFIGKRVEFPAPVSRRLAESINRPIFAKTKVLDVASVDDALEPYSGDGSSILAFGGGVDSSAVRVLFPDAYVVHEASLKDGRILPDYTNEVVDRLSRAGRGRIVRSNQRYLSRPGGWHVWIASTVTAVLTAASRGASYVLTGSNFGSNFLSNGRKYYDKLASRKHHGPSGNYWEQLFWDIGLPVFSPISGMSEIINMKIALEHLARDEVVFCIGDNGGACGRCPKCFRRACIEEFLSHSKADYTSYRNDDVLRVLEKKPTYFGHIYAALMAEGWTPPLWALGCLSHLRPSRFPLRHNPESYELFPADIRNDVTDKVRRFSEPMTQRDMDEMRAWDQALLV